jgi:hypothetical protein
MKRDATVELFELVVYPAEHSVGLPVSASAIAPCVDDTLVVAEQPEVMFVGVREVLEDGEDEQFKTDAFCPPNVALSVACLPSRAERPCAPMPMDNNCDAEGRACI